MRIAYVCVDPGIPVFGTKGASVHIQELVREYRMRGDEVTVYALRRGSHVPEDLADLPVVIHEIREKEPAAREDAQVRAAREITRELMDTDVDLIHERYSLFSTVLADVTGRSQARGILEVNAPLIDEQRTHRVLVNEDAALEALIKQVRAADVTACVSEDISRWVRSHVPDSTRVHTVANGVSTRRITPLVPDPDRCIVTFVGTLKPWHGVEDLVLAAARAREPWILRIIGDGPQRQALEALAESVGVHVDFCGAVPPEKIGEHLAGSSIGVAPYPAVEEGQSYFSPLKVYEYLAAGLPVVASDIGQVRSILKGFGTFVPPSDPQALAQAIDELSRDPRRRQREAELGRRAAVEKHSWSKVLDTIIGFLP